MRSEMVKGKGSCYEDVQTLIKYIEPLRSAPFSAFDIRS